MRKFYLFLFLGLLLGMHVNAQTCNPDFSFQLLTAQTVKFTPAISTDSASTLHTWRFGDGTSVVGAVFPVHTYSPGTYQVKHILVRYNPNGVAVCADSTIRTVIIEAPCITAAFSYIASTSNSLSIQFSNTSPGFTAADSIRWNFGDGTALSYDVNPTHTYATPGTYNVCIRVKKAQTATTPSCVSEVCRTITVISNCNLSASFTVYRDSLSTTNTYHFTNTSTGFAAGDSIRWNFGDGTALSYDVNPTHTYAAPGTYNVCIRVKKPQTANSAPCVSETCRSITITATDSCNLVGSFTYRRDTTASGITYQFVNTSQNFSQGDSIRWTFGDGAASTLINPSHTYTVSGTYRVCIRIQKRGANGVLSSCVREYCQNVVVQVCNLQVRFTQRADSLYPRKIYFTNNTSATASAAAVWSFGDGTSSTSWNAVHEYNSPDRYRVCLTVRSGDCIATSCDSITVVGTPSTTACPNIIVNFNDRRDSMVHNRITFIATANAPILQQVWTIRRLPNGPMVTITGNNPTYLFTDTGSYNVCLRAVFANNCVKELCRVFRINTATPVNSCNMQVFPNPTHTLINAAVHLNGNSLIRVNIYNNMGTLVRQVQQGGVPGNNVVTVNVATLPTGLYTIRAIYEGRECSTVFSKQ